MKKFIFLSILLVTACVQKEYSVKSIIDGDTIELESGEMIRYIGIDTPETRIKQKDGTWLYQPEAYGEAAKEFNRKLVEDKKIRLEYDMVQKDKYNRTLAYVFAGDTFVNAELIKEGYALLYTIPPNIKYVDFFIESQKEARENKRGMWGSIGDEPIPPEDACNFIGQVKYVEGKIINVYQSKNIIILNFGKEKKDFKAVIFKNNVPIFSNQGINPVKDYLNRKVRIYGKIKLYKGAPEIIVDVPEQIGIL